MSVPDTMKAVVLTGHGGLDQLVYHEDWPTPTAKENEVLIKVAACGLNNTDINTRSGWYSKTVSEATTGDAYQTVDENDPTWGGEPITFPRIQGADVCGTVVAAGKGADQSLIGKRVITDNWLRNWSDPIKQKRYRLFWFRVRWWLRRVYDYRLSQRRCDKQQLIGCRACNFLLLLFNCRRHARAGQCSKR